MTAKDKPPLLTDEEIKAAFNGAFDQAVYLYREYAPEELAKEPQMIRLRAVVQAQLDKWDGK